MTAIHTDDHLTVYVGDARAVLADLPAESIQTVVTSPPYWGLRDYGLEPSVWGGDPEHEHAGAAPERAPWANAIPGPNGRGDGGLTVGNRARLTTKEAGSSCPCGAWLGCLGLEPTPELYVAHLVDVFRAVRRVLRSDGTVWLNLGDSYATGAGKVGDHPGGGAQGERWKGTARTSERSGHEGKHGYRVGPLTQPNRMPIPGLKPKDRVLMPARAALALQADGWWLRDEIVWAKPNPMPSSVTDRTTPAHEMVYLLTKSARYRYDADAIRERSSTTRPELLEFGPRPDLGFPGHSSDRRRVKVPGGWDVTKGEGGHGTVHRAGRTAATYADVGADGQRRMRDRTLAARAAGAPHDDPFGNGRNKRSVWTVATEPYPEAHFATFPKRLIEPMILAGAPSGSVVLDPFAGTGTTAVVAESLGRRTILVDASPEYVQQALRRIARARAGGEGAPVDIELDAPAGSLWAEVPA